MKKTSQPRINCGPDFLEYIQLALIQGLIVQVFLQVIVSFWTSMSLIKTFVLNKDDKSLLLSLNKMKG